MRKYDSLNVKRIGQPKDLLGDAYHSLHGMSWAVVLTLFFGSFLIINLIFATLYNFGGDCIKGSDGSFLSYFFFSVQSFTTIGYGHLSPQSNYANVLVTLEAYTGLFCTALMTGIIFSKFSRPDTRVLFSNNALIATRDRKRSLIFRLANGRGNGIVDAEIKATLLIDDSTSEGEEVRRIIPLQLKVDKMPLLSLSLTAVHPIDESSPLFEQDLDSLAEARALIIVTVIGVDNLIWQHVHAQHFYRFDDLRLGEGFKDILTSRFRDGEILYTMDYNNFHNFR